MTLAATIDEAPWAPPVISYLGEDATLSMYEPWLPADIAAMVLEALRQEVAWRQESIQMFGRRIQQPRLVAWYGDAGASYTYSGLRLEPAPWTALLAALHRRVQRTTKETFNSVLCNLYRDGNDSMGMHADDEPELGPAPVVASCSFGAPRTFTLAACRGTTRARIPLRSGSLVVMNPAVQRRFRHGVPKEPRVEGARVNLTFRRIV